MSLFSCCLLVLLSACAIFSKDKTGAERSVNAAGSLSGQQFQVQAQRIQDKKDRARVLKKKAEIEGLSLRSHPGRASMDLKPQRILDTKLSDRDLYAEIVKSYEGNRRQVFESQVGTFIQKYARSPLADDALYLSGLYALSNRDYGIALQEFNRVIERYPKSGKVASALFAKGVALKKMNLLDSSEKVLKQVVSRYPGSPESVRAQGELKLLRR